MQRIEGFLAQHRPLVVLVVATFILSFIPIAHTFLVLGNSWQGIPPAFGDETLYHARVQTIVQGHTGGNPYFIEHSDGPPLVIFGGAWVNAIPGLLGVPFNAALVLNFIVWSLSFAFSAYFLFRELHAPPWIAVCGTVFLYLQSYAHVWRPANLQPVYPFIFLFYIALARFMREQSRRNSILLALATGAAFYLYAFFWQIAVVTLGLLILYAFVRKNLPLLKATLFSSLAGVAIGLPVPLYVLWLSRTSPYFWESLGRLGLVNTHLPMAEVLYSGGWIGIVLVLLAVLYWRVKILREDTVFVSLGFFLAVSGLGLWGMQGSNLVTGKLFETAEHVRILILPWLVFATVSLGVFLWERRANMSKSIQTFSIATIVLVSLANGYFLREYIEPFLPAGISRESWQTQQLYAKPFAWLQQQEKDSVVVWTEPHDFLGIDLPVFTRHFTLYAYWGMLELVPEGEIRERYLISQYFNNPTLSDLKSESEMALYLGRHDFPHEAKTIERGIKLCRIVFFLDKHKECGTVPTPQSLLGDQFFIDLENKFRTDIKPNIKAYLQKYHVSYFLKDKVLNPTYRPETLGAQRVYVDDRFEIYHL